MTQALTLSKFSLLRSFPASVMGHGLIVLLGFVAVLPAQQNSVGPIEVEIASFSLDAGVAHSVEAAQPEFKAPVKEVKASQLDLPDTQAKPKQEAQPQSAPTVVRKTGEGGRGDRTSGKADPWGQYLYSLRKVLHESLRYPRLSRNLGETGRVKVAFGLLRSGEIIDVRITEPCAFERLNLAALEIFERVKRVEPFPESVALARYDATFPINFELRSE